MTAPVDEPRANRWRALTSWLAAECPQIEFELVRIQHHRSACFQVEPFQEE